MRTGLIYCLCLILLMGTGHAIAQSPADDDPGMADYWRFRDPDAYAKMMQDAAEQRMRGHKMPSVAEQLDQGIDLIRASENDWSGALLDAMRNVDDAAKNYPRAAGFMKGIGKTAEILDMLSRLVKVRDEYNKSGKKWDAAVVFGREMAKMLAGNKLGAFVVATAVGAEVGLLPAILLGYVAIKAAEGFLDITFEAYDTLHDRNLRLNREESDKRLAEILRERKDFLGITDDAQITTFTDEKGQTRWNVTWTDDRTGKDFTFVLWANEYGHVVGSDFREANDMKNVLDNMGGDYKPTGNGWLNDLLQGKPIEYWANLTPEQRGAAAAAYGLSNEQVNALNQGVIFSGNAVSGGISGNDKNAPGVLLNGTGTHHKDSPGVPLVSGTDSSKTPDNLRAPQEGWDRVNESWDKVEPGWDKVYEGWDKVYE